VPLVVCAAALVGSLIALSTRSEQALAIRAYVGSARVVRVKDGDTIVVEYASGRQKSIRLVALVNGHETGVDTPEIDARDPVVRQAGEAAKREVDRLCPVGQQVEIVNPRGPDDPHVDCFGRPLRIVRVNGVDVGAWLLRNGYAVVWRPGGTR